MNETSEFDLKTFQSEVFKEYQSLIKKFEMTNSISENGYAYEYRSDSGLIKRSIYRGLNTLTKFVLKGYFSSSQFIERDKKASKIVNDPKIKKVLCPLLTGNLLPEFSKDLKEKLEIELIIILTTALTKKT